MANETQSPEQNWRKHGEKPRAGEIERWLNEAEAFVFCLVREADDDPDKVTFQSGIVGHDEDLIQLLKTFFRRNKKFAGLVAFALAMSTYDDDDEGENNG